MRVLSGIQPSGQLHLGNYFGAVRQFLQLQREGHQCFYFLANYHALTSIRQADQLRELTTHLAAGYLALGIDPDKSVFFCQSDVPQVTELCWILNCICPVSLMEKGTSYKDKVGRGLAPNMGLFDYPVLQAADILIYDSDIVPVGADQKQHVEMTRDIAVKFNAAFDREVLVLPQSYILSEVAVVPGIDGQKMSKSYNNAIEIFLSESATKKRCAQIVTDSTPLEAPKDPDRCNVMALLKLFASPEEAAEIAAKYRAGGYGYGQAKARLAELIDQTFAEARDRYETLMRDPGYVRDVLREGGRKAREVAEVTMERVRQAAGIVVNR